MDPETRQRLEQLVQSEVPLIRADPRIIARLRRAAQEGAARLHHVFADVQGCCVFIGYPRSGHSLVGALLDAHPDVVIAHELDALRFVDAGFTREEIYFLLVENSRLFASLGRRWGQYDYAVPGQWQGRCRSLKVIGDKKGGVTTDAIGRDPSALDRLLRLFGPETKFIHVVRNPFDAIATISRKNREGLDEAIEWFFFLCRANQRARGVLGPESVIDVHHEDMVRDPRGTLRRICGFLGVEAADDYLDACAGIVFPSPKRSREAVAWPKAAVERVMREMEPFAFLRRYAVRE